MPSIGHSDLAATLQVIIALAILPIGGLAVLFSLIFLGGRVMRPRTVRARLRTGAAAAIYLAISAV
jgi:hypothetical protein